MNVFKFHSFNEDNYFYVDREKERGGKKGERERENM